MPVRSTNSTACVGVGEVHLAGADAVLDAAQRAELALDRDAARVRQLDDLARDRDVVLVVRRRLAVGVQRAVHHHAREAELDGAAARLRLVAVVEVQRHGDLGVQSRPRPASGGTGSGRSCSERAPREAWTITGDCVSRAASMMAWICSMLLTLNAPTP